MNFIKRRALPCVYFLVANVYLFLSNLPLLLAWRKTPPGTIFLWEHTARISMDYNVYLSVINQGMHGAWLMHDVWTTEKFNSSLYYFFYIVLGKIGGAFHLLPFVTYHLFRIIFSEIFFIAVYLLCTSVLGKTRGFVAAVTAIIATAVPLVFFTEPNAFVTYVPFWHTFEAAHRYDIMPHYLFAYALLTGFAIIIFQFLKKPSPYLLMVALLSAITLGIVMPSSTTVILIGLPVTFAWVCTAKSIKSKKIGFTKAQMVGISLIVVLCAISVYRMYLENQNGFPWNTWNRDEVNMFNHAAPYFVRDFSLSIGIVLILAIPASIIGLYRFDFSVIYLAFWGFLPLLLQPFADRLNISRYRFTNVMPIVPLSILTVMTVSWLTRYMKPKIIFSVFLLLLLAISIPVSSRYEILASDYVQNKQITFLNLYMPVAWWHAIAYLNTQAPPGSRIMTQWVTSNVLPAYAPVITYLGHTQQTFDFFQKRTWSDRFFTNAMGEAEAAAFLKGNRIDYVFFGYGEKNLSPLISYTALQPVFSEGEYQIYKVR